MAEAAIVVKTQRELSFERTLRGCKEAWVEGDFERAECLNGLCTSLEGMTDEEYEAKTSCQCDECGCDF